MGQEPSGMSGTGPAVGPPALKRGAEGAGWVAEATGAAGERGLVREE